MGDGNGAAWRLTTQELQVLWPHADAEWPSALAAGYGGHIESADDLRRADAEVRTRLNATMTPSKSAAISALAAPKYSIAVNFLDVRDHTNVLKIGRVYSALQTGSTAYVASQASTDVMGAGGDITISRVPASTWTRHLIGLFPAADGAGVLPQDPAVVMTTYPIGESLMSLAAPEQPAGTAAAAFGRTAIVSTSANVRVSVRSPIATSPGVPMTVLINDVIDDGRYALLMDDPALAVPVDDDGAAKFLNRVVNLLRSRQEQTA